MSAAGDRSISPTAGQPLLTALALFAQKALALAPRLIRESPLTAHPRILLGLLSFGAAGWLVHLSRQKFIEFRNQRHISADKTAELTFFRAPSADDSAEPGSAEADERHKQDLFMEPPIQYSSINHSMFEVTASVLQPPIPTGSSDPGASAEMPASDAGPSSAGAPPDAHSTDPSTATAEPDSSSPASGFKPITAEAMLHSRQKHHSSRCTASPLYWNDHLCRHGLRFGPPLDASGIFCRHAECQITSLPVRLWRNLSLAVDCLLTGVPLSEHFFSKGRPCPDPSHLDIFRDGPLVRRINHPLYDVPLDHEPPIMTRGHKVRTMTLASRSAYSHLPISTPIETAKLLSALAFDLQLRSSIAHRSISCDNCNMSPLLGIRYTCLNCPNYDLCQLCESIQSQALFGITSQHFINTHLENNDSITKFELIHDPQHIFMKINLPVSSMLSSFTTNMPLMYPPRSSPPGIPTAKSFSLPFLTAPELAEIAAAEPLLTTMEISGLFVIFTSVLSDPETMRITRPAFYAALGHYSGFSILTEDVLQPQPADEDQGASAPPAPAPLQPDALFSASLSEVLHAEQGAVAALSGRPAPGTADSDSSALADGLEHAIRLAVDQVDSQCSQRELPPLTYIADRLYDFYDFDGDGYISFQDYVHAYATTHRGSQSAILQSFFRIADQDRDGHIDKHDLNRFLRGCFSLLQSTIFDQQRMSTEDNDSAVWNSSVIHRDSVVSDHPAADDVFTLGNDRVPHDWDRPLSAALSLNSSDLQDGVPFSDMQSTPADQLHAFRTAFSELDSEAMVDQMISRHSEKIFARLHTSTPGVITKKEFYEQIILPLQRKEDISLSESNLYYLTFFTEMLFL
ncbi:hypothetical protein H696_03695 [Fonticula alba]|uniref:Uncharacterized protein n=1 Tax=Fonticula alba TaxID=691883 RepID=A0A058Z5Q0_FONAL|nr:hypothetical protein H696_03695 [Fonticula alba]KCV69268.1 hypothetical protein H696_03695 [Fonticula alba]|eukprot:XP_009495833.1 hypothetical protein H696_03695 [Fonticula alba]